MAPSSRGAIGVGGICVLWGAAFDADMAWLKMHRRAAENLPVLGQPKPVNPTKLPCPGRQLGWGL